MKLVGVEISEVALPLRVRVGTSAGVHQGRPILYLRVVADSAEGWGECAALQNGTAVDPDVATALLVLRNEVVPRLFRATTARGGEMPPASLVSQLFGEDPVQRTPAACLEMALLDAELVAQSQSLAHHLGVAGARVAVGAIVGIPTDRKLSTLVAQAGVLVDIGYQRVRVKIAPGWDVEPIRELRHAFPDLMLQADANGAYRIDDDGLADAKRLVALDALSVRCLEQPLDPRDLASHAQLADLLDTPIGLDESLSSVRRVTDALRYGACEVACLKPARLGGLLPARVALQRCHDAGADAFVGGFFESGLARAANLAISALDGFTLPGDISEPHRYLEGDPFDYPVSARGVLAVPDSPGVGSRPDPGRLAAVRVASEWIPYPGA
jgi:o-succinylbenzoate synthase